MQNLNDKVTNEVLNEFQKLKGNGYFYAIPPIKYNDIIVNTINKFKNKHTDASVLVVVDNYELFSPIKSLLLNNEINAAVLTKGYINPKYMYRYELLITIAVEDIDVLITLYRQCKFKLSIFTKYLNATITNKLADFVKPIITSVSVNSLITNNIYTPVEKYLNSVTLTDEDREKYNDDDKYIKECMTIFETMDNITKCREGDRINNISAISFRDEFARRNGWNERLDMTVDYYREIDAYYNPNKLLERATNFYNIVRNRSTFIASYESKIDIIKDIVYHNIDKKIIIVCKSGKFANLIAERINIELLNIADCYHNEIEDRALVDDNGEPVLYKSGANKGKQRVLKSQAISTVNLDRYNNDEINVLCIKYSSDVKMACACDILINTTTMYDDIFEIKTRFRYLVFNSIPNIVYTIYCANTIEHKKLFSEKQNSLIKVICEEENNVIYDENLSEIIL